MKLVTFLDSVQRTIIGEDVSTNNDTTKGIIKIKNPAVVSTAQQMDPNTRMPTGQLALQLLPTFFKEFQGDCTQPIIISYHLDSISMIDFEGGFDVRLIGQYEGMYQMLQQPRNVPASVPSNDTNSKIVKLFDDDEPTKG